MSWHFSKELVSVLLRAECSITESFAESSRTNIVALFSWLAKTMEVCPPSQSGMTFEHLTDMSGVAELTSLLPDSHVNLFQMQECKKESTTNETCGQTRLESLAKYDPDLCSWKMFLPLFNTWEEYSPETWPESGTIKNGELYPLQISADRILENAGGCVPKPDVSGSHNKKSWPTPTASDYKGGTSAVRKGTNKRRVDRLDHCIEPDYEIKFQDGKRLRLNPDWVEWLMHVPVGWSKTEPLKSVDILSWEKDPFEDVSRAIRVYPERKHRLVGLGNGQVPKQAFIAFLVLT